MLFAITIEVFWISICTIFGTCSSVKRSDSPQPEAASQEINRNGRRIDLRKVLKNLLGTFLRNVIRIVNRDLQLHLHLHLPHFRNNRYCRQNFINVRVNRQYE